MIENTPVLWSHMDLFIFLNCNFGSSPSHIMVTLQCHDKIEDVSAKGKDASLPYINILEARDKIGALSDHVDLGASISMGVEAHIATGRRRDPSSYICSQFGLEQTILKGVLPVVFRMEVPP